MLKFKIIGLALALVLIAGLVAVASGATGAYFSDSKDGKITGTSGSIKVTTTQSGGTGENNLVFAWDNMLPGVPYSATAVYQNTGKSVQDVWLVFPNKTALSALNSLGNYGAVRVTSTNGCSFYSDCLSDHPVDQGAISYSGHTIRELPQMVRLAQNVGPTASGSMTFTFAYSSNLKDQAPEGLFNVYPTAPRGGPYGGYPSGDGAMPGSDQYYVSAQDGADAGLPFQIVATQHNVTPGDAGSYAGL